MGIDLHAFHFLRYARKKQDFGRVATIGRQSLLADEATIKKHLNLKNYRHEDYVDGLLKAGFGAALVESFDYSDFEGATHVVDFNLPLPKGFKTYDTVVNSGSIEHVFDIAQALRNISELAAVGGQIIHMAPANNFCGHGFWQISPELFHSLYSEENGFAETEVFLANLRDSKHWYEIVKRNDGRRMEASSSTPLHVLCRTRLARRQAEISVQQSDYVVKWRHGTIDLSSGTKKPSTIKKLRAMAARHGLRDALDGLENAYFRFARLFSPTIWPTRRASMLKRHKISDLTAAT